MRTGCFETNFETRVGNGQRGDASADRPAVGPSRQRPGLNRQKDRRRDQPPDPHRRALARRAADPDGLRRDRGGGHAILFVGGCVRNALLGRPVADIDLATDARPEAVIALAKGAGLNPVPTGIAHGTITVVAAGQPFQVTTFRRDVETFGRHAVVAFSDDIAEDAARRDFTLNALYALPDGTVVDPLGGLPDLRAGRVRFVGDPAARIAEDYLRILRFFRMTAWYGDPAAGLDRDSLAACAARQEGSTASRASASAPR